MIALANLVTIAQWPKRLHEECVHILATLSPGFLRLQRRP